MNGLDSESSELCDFAGVNSGEFQDVIKSVHKRIRTVHTDLAA